MASAGAIALTGALVAGTLFGVSPAAAVTYQNGWNGRFEAGQLWAVGGTASAYALPQWLPDAASATPADFATRLRAAYDQAGDRAGQPCPGGWDVLATGPVEMAQGSARPVQIGWDTATGRAGLVQDGTGACHAVKDQDGILKGMNGGEVDPISGVLFYVGEAPQPVLGTDNYFPLGIGAAVVENRRHPNEPDFQLREWLTVEDGWSEAEDYVTTLAAAAAGAGRTGNLDGEWSLSADLAVDATGAVYRLARFDVPATQLDHWALLRFEVERDRSSGYPETDWSHNVVRVFEDVAANDATGLALIGADLYSSHADGSIRRWNISAGTSQLLGQAPGVADLTTVAAHSAITGRVQVVDQGGDLANTLGGERVELWREVNGTRSLAGVTATAPVSGFYWLPLPEDAAGTYYVRVRTPRRSDGLPTIQVRASGREITPPGYSYYYARAKNEGTPLCATAEGDYQDSEGGGYYYYEWEDRECYGARGDAVDPAQVTDPLAAAGGANHVTRIALNDPTEPVNVDFTFEAHLGWGDAPAPYPTLEEDGGPYANPELLTSGAGSHGFYAQPNPKGLGNSTHLTFSPAGTASGSPVSMQGGLLAAGQTYTLSADVWGELTNRSTAKLWLDPLTANGTPSGQFSQLVLSGRPVLYADDDSYAYIADTYTAPTTEPAGGFQLTYGRMRASVDPAVTPTSRALTGHEADSGVVPGSVDDIGYGIASHVVRVRPRLVDVPTLYPRWRFWYTFTNTSDRWPSSSQTVVDPGYWVKTVDPVAVAVTNASQPVGITLTGVLPEADGNLDGWELDAARTKCSDTFTGQPIAFTTNGNTVQVSAPAATGWRDVTCVPAYQRTGYGYGVTTAIRPSPLASSPRPVGQRDAYRVQPTLKTQYTDSTGSGLEVFMTLTPAGGGATADGAKFQATDAANMTCSTWLATGGLSVCDAAGITATQAGEYTLTVWEADTADSPETFTLYFAGEITPPGPRTWGEMWIEDTEPVVADYGLEDGAPGYVAPWDYFTIHLRAWMAAGTLELPYEGLESRIRPSSTYVNYPCGYSELHFTDAVAVQGDPGHYTFTVASSCAGEVALYPYVSIPNNSGHLIDFTWRTGSPRLEFANLGVPDWSQSYLGTWGGEAKIGYTGTEIQQAYDYVVDAEVVLIDANGSWLEWPTVLDEDDDEILDPAWRDQVTWSASNPASIRVVPITEDQTWYDDAPRFWVVGDKPGEYCPAVDVTWKGVTRELVCDEPIRFTGDYVDLSTASARVTQTPGQPANMDTGAPEAEWGRQTVIIEATDAFGYP
ncbi:MAG: hypothetical protein LBC97_05650, partial [Bifidobacteriaceae bacterium]|nr:hypothetical protein [Bifidobacteriaceae bacterium]